jgi:NAD(P)-dependent dehydrogenase (short-subunit alcohol dehydrogenase family)
MEECPDGTNPSLIYIYGRSGRRSAPEGIGDYGEQRNEYKEVVSVNIQGKTAIVTGGASGLGEATVLRLFAAGANVVIADLNAEKGNALAAKLGERATFVSTNVTSTEDVQKLVKTTLEKFGAIDILVNNAGVGAASRTLMKDGPMPLEWFKAVVDVNLIAVFDVLRQVAWEMAKNEPDELERGVIVNLASVAAFDGQIGQAAYSASKAAVIGFTKALAKELAASEIRVNCVAPGVIDTSMNENLSKAEMKNLISEIPLSRIGKTDDIASAVLFLAEDAPYMTGQVLGINGGLII